MVKNVALVSLSRGLLGEESLRHEILLLETSEEQPEPEYYE